MYTKLSAGFLRLGLIMGLLLAALPTQTASAAIRVRHVKMGGASSGECLTWATACDFQYALVTKAVAGDQIWVQQGVYLPGSARTDTFTLKEGVAVYGGFVGTETLLSQRKPSVNVTLLSGDIGTPHVSADNSYHVVTTGSAMSAAVLDGFTITGGNASDTLTSYTGVGGGIFDEFSSPTLRNLVITGNTSFSYGGGMYNGGSPVLTNVTFSNNSSTDINSAGGGLYYTGGGYAILNHITFNGNTAASGGGMYNSASALQLTSVSFSANRAYSGGGMFNAGNGLYLSGVSFKSNSANIGGGLYNTGSSTSVLKKVTFAGNTAATNGGGLYNITSSLQLTGVSFIGNWAGAYGGGLDSENGTGTPYTAALSKVTFGGNTALSGGGMSNISTTAGNNTATLVNVTFSRNRSTGTGVAGGGGLYNTGTANLSRVVFSGDSAVTAGGGMFNNSGIASLTNVSFNANTSDDGSGGGLGGGLANINATATLTNITFSRNSAALRGGGAAIGGDASVSLKNTTFNGNSAAGGGAMYIFLSNPQLNNLTVSGNTATMDGGNGMFVESDSHPVIRNTIFWDSGSSELAIFDTSTMSLSYSVLKGYCPPGATCVGVTSKNPWLAPLANNGGFTKTMALQLGSSAIDKGNLCEPKDQRGILRPQGPRCDIGAYEFVP